MNIPAVLLCFLGVLTPFEQNGKWGYKDSGGKVVLSPRYQVAQEFSAEGIAAVVDAKGWAYIDPGGRVLVRPLVVDNGPDYFAGGLARFREAGKVGFFDTRGKVTIPPKYSFALPFSEGLAAVCEGCAEKKDDEHRAVTGGRWGFIDARGTLVIPLRFEEAGPFEKGRARVRVGGKWQHADKSGKVAP